MEFDDLSIWVQCHNLPLAFLNKVRLEKIGNIEDWDAGESEMLLGSTARIRIRIEIKNSLLQNIWVENAHEEVYVILAYERRPNFFYGCEMIIHSIRECDDVGADKQKVIWDLAESFWPTWH